MQQHGQPILKQAQPSIQPVAAPMRALSAEEARAVVGGPIIDNGISVATQSASSSKG